MRDRFRSAIPISHLDGVMESVYLDLPQVMTATEWDQLTSTLQTWRGVMVGQEVVAANAMAAAWDQGFSARVEQDELQRRDATHPITRTNPYGVTP